MDYSAMSIAELSFEGLKVAAPLFSLFGVLAVWADQKIYQRVQKEKDFEFGRELAELNKQISVEVKLSEFEMKHLEQITLSRVADYTRFLDMITEAQTTIIKSLVFNKADLDKVSHIFHDGPIVPIHGSNAIHFAFTDFIIRIEKASRQWSQLTQKNLCELKEEIIFLLDQMRLLIERDIIDVHDFSGILDRLNDRIDEHQESLLKRGIKPLKTEIEKQDASSREVTHTSDKQESSPEES